MICMNTYVITRGIYLYPLYCSHDCVCPVLWTIHYAWPMTSPLQIIMIMHELHNELKTSVNWACWCPPCGCEVTIDNMVGGVTSTRRKVREKLSNLLCLTRCGFYVHLEEDGHFYSNMSMYGRLAERNNCHFSNCPSSQTKLLRSLAFAAILFRCCSRNDACEAVW